MQTIRVVLAMFLTCAIVVSAEAQSLVLNEPGSAVPMSSMERPARLQVRDVALPAALTELHQRAGVNLLFSPSMIPAAQKVSCDCMTVSVREALASMLSGSGLVFREVDGQILVHVAEPTPAPDRGPLGSLSTQFPVSLAFSRGIAAVREDASPADAAASPFVVGSITGMVRDAGTLAPVGAVQVHIPGLQLGVLTQQDGRFLLVNVPAGTHVIRAERIGYRAVSQEVTVVDDQAVEVNFDLTEDALSLDEIIVTGTAGQARRREVGNTVSQINTADLVESVSNVDEILQARAPGVWVSEGSGGSGSGARIRLRGNVSVSMSNQPLIYVDGVRIKSEPYPAGFSGSADRGSPLNDINPADIDRMEIIKGAAATTLYGTEAAAGVIQIFTKSGSEGRPVWTAQVDQGLNYIRPWGPDLDTCQEPGGGMVNCKYMFHEPALRNGWRQRYSASVRGGQQDFGYFLSFAYDDSEGGIMSDFEKRTSFRGNARFRPTEKMLLEFNSSLSRQDVTNTRQGNTGTSSVMVLNQQYWGPESRSRETLFEILRRSAVRQVNRFITGVTANYTPIPALTNRVTLGYDVADWRGTAEIPYGWRNPGDELGRRVRDIDQTRMSSFDYVSSLQLDLASEWRTTLSVGAQAVASDQEAIRADGRDFPGPGEYTVGSTARRTASEDRLRVITGGFFAQSLLDFRDRYFLTLGLRVDGNSAFGESLGLQPYPKASLSYVVSDETFWPEALGEVKLRAAYGFAGRAPGAFDAVRTWDPLGFGPERPALEPANLGNPEMGPERTAELEAGFDGAFLNGRLRLDYTFYTQTTSDALFAVRAPLSAGGWDSQLENVGEIKNWGHEVLLQATMVDYPSFNWDLGLSVATNHSEVVSLGGAPRFHVGNYAWIEEGQPVPVIRGDMIKNFWEKGQPEYALDTVFGPHFPTLSLSPTTSFTLPGGIVLSGRAEYHGGWWLRNFQEVVALSRQLDWPACYPAYAKRDEGRLEDVLAWEWGKCLEARHRPWNVPGDFFELRDITVGLPLTRFVPGTSQAQLNLSARNLWYWTKAEVMVGHPEMNDQRGGNLITRSIAEQIPPGSSLVASLRVVF